MEFAAFQTYVAHPLVRGESHDERLATVTSAWSLLLAAFPGGDQWRVGLKKIRVGKDE